MKILQLLSLCMAAGFAMPLDAWAQSQTIPSGVVIRVGAKGDEVDRDLKYVYMNGRQCVDDVPVKFEITEVFTVNQVLEVWVGPNGTDCTVGTNRDRPTNGSAPCRQVSISNSQKPGTQPKVDSSAQALFGSTSEEDGDDGEATCALEGQRWVYIMALQTESQDSGSQNATPGNFKKVGFYVDVDEPSTPTDIDSSDGETEVTVSWSVPSEIKDDVDARVRVYYDASAVSGGADGGTCSSSILVPGETPPATATYREEIGTATSLKVSPANLGLNAVGDVVPAAVASVDAAGNVSVLSDVVCVGKIDTDGFYDRCKADEECLDGLDSCTASPRRTPGTLAAATLTLLLVIVARRRRRIV